MDNNLKDTLQIWSPLPDLPSKMSVEAIHDDYEGFRILLKSDDSDVLRITFKDKITYRNTDESEYLKLWGNNDNEIFKNSFFKVLNSSFLDFFYQEMNENKYCEKPSVNIEHFLIFTECDCIDILSRKPPLVEWI